MRIIRGIGCAVIGVIAVVGGLAGTAGADPSPGGPVVLSASIELDTTATHPTVTPADGSLSVTFFAYAMAVDYGGELPEAVPAGTLTFSTDGSVVCSDDVVAFANSLVCSVTYTVAGPHTVQAAYTTGGATYSTPVYTAVIDPSAVPVPTPVVTTTTTVPVAPVAVSVPPVAPVAPVTAPTGQLAFTGLNVTPLLESGAALILLGSLVLLVARRRQVTTGR